MKTNKKGISLIVLAITIIVMIILATAIILSVSGKNIIGSAKEATAANDLASAKHAVAVAKGEWELNERDGHKTFKSYAEAKLLAAGLTRFNVSEKGVVTTIYIDEDNNEALIPEGYVASEVKGENKISTGLVIYEGTESVTDTNVLQARLARNQFVWVPVDDISTFERIEWNKGNKITETTSYNMDDVLESEEYLAMYESIKENKGFYIARYEAGKEGTDTLVSKKNANVWNLINWADSKAKSETLSSETAISHLIYGEEWDAALNFISKTDEGYATNSEGKGNYTVKILSTGSSEAYAVNNIYDMAGNVTEWTIESYSSTGRVRRGGFIGLNGTNNPASYRYFSSTSLTATPQRFPISTLFEVTLVYDSCSANDSV